MQPIQPASQLPPASQSNGTSTCQSSSSSSQQYEESSSASSIQGRNRTHSKEMGSSSPLVSSRRSRGVYPPFLAQKKEGTGLERVIFTYPLFPGHSLKGTYINRIDKSIILDESEGYFPVRKAIRTLNTICVTFLTVVFSNGLDFNSGKASFDLINNHTCLCIPHEISPSSFASVISVIRVASWSLFALSLAFEYRHWLPFSTKAIGFFGSPKNSVNHFIRHEIQSKNSITGKTVYLILKSESETLKCLLYELSFEQIIQGLKECCSKKRVPADQLLARSYRYFDPFLKDLFKTIMHIHTTHQACFGRDVEEAILADGDMVNQLKSRPYLLKGLIVYLKLLYPKDEFGNLVRLKKDYKPELSSKLRDDIVTVRFFDRCLDISRSYLEIVAKASSTDKGSTNTIDPSMLEQFSKMHSDTFKEFYEMHLHDNTWSLDEDNIFNIATLARLLKSEKVLKQCFNWCVDNIDYVCCSCCDNDIENVSIYKLPENVFAGLDDYPITILDQIENYFFYLNTPEMFLTIDFTERFKKLMIFLKHTGLGHFQDDYYDHFLRILQNFNEGYSTNEVGIQTASLYAEEMLQALINLTKMKDTYFLDAFRLMQEMYSRFVNTRKSLYYRIAEAKNSPKTSLEKISLSNFFSTAKGKQMLGDHCFGYLPPFLNHVGKHQLTEISNSTASSSYPVIALPEEMTFQVITPLTKKAFLDTRFPVMEGPSVALTAKKIREIVYILFVTQLIFLHLTRLGSEATSKQEFMRNALFFGEFFKSIYYIFEHMKTFRGHTSSRSKRLEFERDAMERHNRVAHELFSIPYDDRFKEIFEKLSFKQVLESVKHVETTSRRKYTSKEIKQRIKQYWNHFDPNVKSIYKNGLKVCSYAKAVFSQFTSDEEDMEDENILHFYEFLKGTIPHYGETMKVVKTLKRASSNNRA